MNGKDLSGAKLLAKARKGVDAQVEALASEVDEVSRGDIVAAIFGRMIQLWRYSFHNQFLILTQRPGVLEVKGRTQWERVGRKVRDGERPIFIYQPGSATGWPFLVGQVFDVLQTEGSEGAPSIVKEAEAWLEPVEAAAGRLGVTLHTLPAHLEAQGGLLGGANPDRIVVHAGLAAHERLGVLFHEYAHVLLHLKPDTVRPPRRVRELEAEACAYVVAQALGVADSEGLGTPAEYISWVGATGAELLLSLRRIAAGSRAILTAIEGRRPRPRIPAWKVPVEEVALAG